MPKDEFDPEDPMELNGMAFLTEEDTTDAMAECFIEEFMRLGYNHKQILALFRNPHYLGMHMVLQNRGEPLVRAAIAETFARWGRAVSWPAASTHQSGVESIPAEAKTRIMGREHHRNNVEATHEFDATATDPMGAALPKIEACAKRKAALHESRRSERLEIDSDEPLQPL